jgi:hypothetical protein
MTVKELIKQLEKMPPNAKVIYHDGDNGWVEPSVEYTTKICKYVYAPTTEYIYGSFVNITSDC